MSLLYRLLCIVINRLAMKSNDPLLAKLCHQCAIVNDADIGSIETNHSVGFVERA